MRCTWWRLSAILCAALGPQLLCFAAELRPEYCIEEKADRVSEPALFRCPRFYSGGIASPGRTSRRQSGGHRHRSSDTVGRASSRSHHEYEITVRCAENGNPRRQCCETVWHENVVRPLRGLSRG